MEIARYVAALIVLGFVVAQFAKSRKRTRTRSQRTERLTLIGASLAVAAFLVQSTSAILSLALPLALLISAIIIAVIIARDTKKPAGD